MGRRIGLPGLTSAWPLALLAPLLAFAATSYDRTYHTDFWHHLARGRAIVTEGRLLNEDRFTYTVPGTPFQDANWLTQVVYYELYDAGGLSLVQLVNSLTLAAVFGVLVYLGWRGGGSIRVAAVLCVFAFFAMWQVLIIRPQTFSLLLFVMLYTILLGAERRPWLLLFPPVVLALWANLHGGFPVGLVLVGTFLAAAGWEAVWSDGWRVWRRPQVVCLALCFGACVGATLINPYGWKVYQYVGVTSSRATARQILEWLPPGTTLFMSKLWIISVLLTVVAFALPGRRPTARDVFLILVFLAPTFGALRMVAWWLLVSTPILAAQLTAGLPRPIVFAAQPEERSPVWSLVSGVLLLAAVACAPQWSHRGYPTEEELETATHEMRGADGGTKRVFARFEWGEYLGWALQPDGYTVFMDGRIEIYPDPVWEEYLAVTNARPGWQDVLDHYQVDWLVLDADYHRETGLLPAVEQAKATWQHVTQVGSAVLFRRKIR
jgi:hypothetical protein